MVFTKAELRRQALLQRQALTYEAVAAFSEQIIQRLIQAIPWQDYHVVHLYLADHQRKEVDTWPLLHYLWANQPHIKTVTNRMNLVLQQIDCYEINPQTICELSTWGLQEPCLHTCLVNPATIDLMILPLLACDQHGMRLGYGKGYYDQLLSRCVASIRRIGINYFPPLTVHIPHDAHDVPIQQLITPQEVYLKSLGECSR